MSVVLSRAPLRISLGGGGTDLPSYYTEREGFVVGGAINKYVYMFLHSAFQGRYRMKYSVMEDVEEIDDIVHPILREALRRHWTGSPLEIASIADVPAGTGLGSSGAYTVCLIKGLAALRRLTVTPGTLAEAAAHIEIDVLGEPVGKQDQYVAAHGGICAYTFRADGTVQVEPLELSADTHRSLRDQLLLFFTGETRSAGAVLADQNSRCQQHDAAMIANLDRTLEMGHESRALLEKGELEDYARLMHEHWETKRRRSASIETERINQLYELAVGNGAIGGKLVGAGGGGFLLVYSRDPERTREAMRSAGAAELAFDFEFTGATASEAS